MIISLDMYQTLFAAVCVLMLGRFLKARIGFLEKFCIPAPVIGGVLFAVFTCLCYVTGIAEFEFDDILKEVCMVFFFTSVGFQANLKVLKSGGKSLIIFLGLVVALILCQNFLAVGLADLLGISPMIGLCTGSIPMVGGHGTAATFGASFEELCGWDEALTIGQTFATIGILSGVILGALCINVATKKGATRLISEASQLPDSMLTGLVPKDEQESVGRATVHSMSLDPLAWHLALVLIAAGGGYVITTWLNSLVPGLSVPTFSVGMLCGVVVQFVLKLLKLTDHVDRDIVSKVGNSTTDYLVGFAVASIKLSVVVKYAVPLVVLSLIGLAFVFGYLLLVSRKLFHNFWFERGIFIFGWSTGVAAIGVTLLRVVDPQLRSKALEDYGMAYVLYPSLRSA